MFRRAAAAFPRRLATPVRTPAPAPASLQPRRLVVGPVRAAAALPVFGARMCATAAEDDYLAIELTGPDQKGVFVLQMKDGKENRFTPAFFSQLFQALDKVEAHSGPTALVVTGTGKFFSNGFDFEWLQTGGTAPLESIHKMIERFLRLSVPSVSAINGHAFAGGAMLAMASDYKVMNSSKGFLCVNELLLGLAFTEPMMALFDAKIPLPLLAPVVLGAQRFGAADLLKHGMINAAVPSEEVLPAACKMAGDLAKIGHKKKLYKRVKESTYKASLAKIDGQKLQPIPLPTAKL